MLGGSFPRAGRLALSSGAWVLVSDGGRGGSRDAVAAVRALEAGGYLPAVTVSNGSLLGMPSRYAARRVEVPPVSTEGYADAVRAEMTRGSYLTVLPASEDSLIALGGGLTHLIDKVKLHEGAERVGIPTPPSRTFSGRMETLAAGSELEYPVVVKPAIRRSSAVFVRRREDLASALTVDGPTVVQRFMNEGLRAASGVIWRGRLVAAVHERWLRIWPDRCGLACAAETVAPDLDLEKRLVELMRGYEGIFCAQLAGPYLFDLNLRVYSSHPLAVAAGVNLVALSCDLLRGQRVEDTPQRPRTGAFYRWLEGDVRRVLVAVRRGDLAPRAALEALRPRRSAAHSTESLRDPGPLLSRLLLAASRAPHKLVRPRSGR